MRRKTNNKIYRYKNKLKELIKKMFEKKEEPITILEYSVEKSEMLGKRVSVGKKFNRPSRIHHKSGFTRMNREDDKVFNKMMEEARKTKLENLYEKENIKNGTFFAFVDKMIGTKINLVDNSAVYEIDLGKTYNIAGDFILINLTKVGENIKVNKLIRYIH